MPSPALFVFTVVILFLAAILVNGYALNLLRLPADPLLIFVLLAIELAALGAVAARRRVRIAHAPLELAGFLLVVVGTFLYFFVPTWPTLFAPSYSGDPALHLRFINAVYSTGHLITDHPGGPPRIAATLAHWLDWDYVRVMHPVAAVWLALTAGAVYGIACNLLRSHFSRLSRPFATCASLALFAPFALYIAWGYFAGIVMGPNYFYSQAAGQLFIIACAWFVAEYERTGRVLWFLLAALMLISTSVLYQLWMVMPAALLAWILWQDFRKGGETRKRALLIALTALGALILFVFALALVNPRLLPPLEFLRADPSAPLPNLEALGGRFVIVPLLGIFLAILDLSRLSRLSRFRVFRALSRLSRSFVPFRDFSRFALVFLASALLQTFALWIARVGFGGAQYWLSKTLFLWVYPLAVLSVLPLARAVEFAQQKNWRVPIPSVAAFVIVFAALAVAVIQFQPPYFTSLANSDMQAALWAKQNLDTNQVNYLGTKSWLAQMIGVGIWNEKFADDALVDFARLGPRTYEEWRTDSMWGDYLLVTSGQFVPSDPTVQTLYRNGNSAILAKPRAQLPTPSTTLGNFGETLTLTTFHLPITSFYAGETITATAQFIARRVPQVAVVWRVQLRDRDNNAVAEARLAPFDDKFPLQRWTVGKTLTQTLTLPLSPEIRPGLYDLQIGLYHIRDGEPLRFTSAAGESDDVMSLGSIKIIQSLISNHQLSSATPLDARIGDFARLYGYRLIKQSPIRRGDAFRVELYWQAEQRAPTDYTVFVQLLDARGNLIAQRDSAPRGGTYPTSIWDAGEVIADSYTLTVPPDADAGAYQLIVGMYHWQTLQRLPVTDAEYRALGDHVILPVKIQTSP